VGGGISGLVCAYALRRAGVDVLVLERSACAGGLIGTERREGFLVERGPQSFAGTAEIDALSEELGLSGEKILAPARAPRFLLVDGVLRQAPLNPYAFFTSALVDAKTKWRVLQDAIGHTSPPAGDESVADFVRRKFTVQLLDRLVAPFVSGIYAGDPEEMSLRAAFPELAEAEEKSGSIVRGMRAVAKQKKDQTGSRTLQSFREGNQTLVQALAKELGAAVRCDTEAVGLRKHSAGFSVLAGTRGQVEEIHANHLIFGAPTDTAGKLMAAIDPSFETLFSLIKYSSTAVVSLGFRNEDLGHALDGFGFLVPRSEKLRVLGTVWNSSLFAGRAPAGHALVTSFLGGATDPAAVSLSEQELITLVQKELTPILHIRGPAVFSNVTKWSQAIPQYTLGHSKRLEALEVARLRYPGLWFVGNYFNGPAIGACVSRALSVAAAISESARER
jgi:oxygen-dependent protoporphyrinogen oxidase